MRPFSLKLGEKYAMLHGRRVDFTSCNFNALALLVHQILSSLKIYFLPCSIIYYYIDRFAIFIPFTVVNMSNIFELINFQKNRPELLDPESIKIRLTYT